MNYRKELDNIKTKLEQRKLKKAKLEERLENLNNQKKEIMSKLKEEKIESYSDLKNKIEELEDKLNKGINQCKKLMN